METTALEKEQLKTIIKKLIAGDKDWLNRQEILWGDKGLYWVVNYRQGDRNEYNRLVRGMIVKKPMPGWRGDPLELIKSFPFTRFYNQHEKEADHVNLSNAEMLEKLDGSMVGVFFPTRDPNDPHWHTRKMVSTHEPDMEKVVGGFHGTEYKLMPLIGKYVKSLKFDEGDTHYTYVLEFIHDATAVLTKYKKEQYGLYLLGARNVVTHKEPNEDRLDHIAAKIGAYRPRRWDSVADQDEIHRMMKEISEETPDFEGFVFRDKATGKRIKLKDPDYVKLHHLLGQLSFKHLVPLWLEGEIEEILAYFPHAKERVDEIEEKYNKYIDKAVEAIKFWRDKKLDRKSLALQIFGKDGLEDHFLRSQIMRLYQEPDDAKIKQGIKKTLKEVALGRGKGDGSPKKLMKIIGLEDDEPEGVEES
jgi:hypothetical protein